MNLLSIFGGGGNPLLQRVSPLSHSSFNPYKPYQINLLFAGILLFGILWALPLNAQETSANFFLGGSIIIGADTRDCSSGLAGSMRYNTSTNKIEFCNGTGWIVWGES